MLGNNKEPDRSKPRSCSWNHEEYINESIALFERLIPSVKKVGH